MKKKGELFYKDLSYKIRGIFYKVHNELSRYAKEVQYCDKLEKYFIEENIQFKREHKLGNTRNRLDFLIENKIIIEVKAKNILTREDYFQTQRYLQFSKLKLAFLVNFRAKYLIPKRIVRIDKNQN